MIALRKSDLFQAAVSLLYPVTCTICGKNVPASEYLCDECRGTRERERGFNQASLLSESLSAQTSIRSQRVLERVRYTTTQTALDRSERMENLHNAFRL